MGVMGAILKKVACSTLLPSSFNLILILIATVFNYFESSVLYFFLKLLRDAKKVVLLLYGKTCYLFTMSRWWLSDIVNDQYFEIYEAALKTVQC